MNTFFEVARLALTAIIPILGWWFGWWVASNNFKKQRYDKVKESILLEIRNLKDVSISHYVKRDSSAVYIIQSFKELSNILVEESFLKNEPDLTSAWRSFRITATSLSDERVLYKNDSDEVAEVLIAYNALHKQLLKHKYKRKK